MAGKRTPIAVTAGRTVVSACLTAGCWILWVFLLVVAGFLVTVHFSREIPVPPFILKRLESRIELADLKPRFGATRFDPTGTLVIEDVRVLSPMFAEPVASARAIVLNLDLWAVFVGDFDVDSVDIIGLQLNCPAMLSPSGTNMPVVRDLHASFVRDGARWHVPMADFRIGQLVATIHGDWDPRGSSGAKLPSNPKEWVRRYYDVARTVSNKLGQLASLGRTRIDIDFTIRRNEPLHITVDGTAEHLNARGLMLNNVQLRIDHDDARRPGPPMVIDFSAPDVIVEDRVNVIHPRVHETCELEVNPFKFTPGPLIFTADKVSWNDASVDALIFRTSLSGLPAIEGELTASHGGSVVSALGSVDPRDGSVSARMSARFDPATLEEGLDVAIRRIKRNATLKRLHFSGPVTVDAEMRMADHWQFRGAQGRFHALDADILGVPAEVASGTFEATPDDLYATNLVLDGKNLYGRGSYRMNFASRDYRFLIKGRTFPDTIEPWFTEWWSRFWERFTFSRKTPLTVDLSVAGRWRDRRQTLVEGAVETGPMTIYELPFDHVATHIFIRDEYYDVLDVAGSVGDRTISGNFTYDNRESGDSYRRIRFDAHSTLEIPRYSRLAGPELPEILKPYVFEGPESIATSGSVDFNAGGMHENVTTSVTSSGTFRFWEFPIQDAKFDVHSKDGTVDITGITAGYGSGQLTGTVHSAVGPDGRTVQFSAKLVAAKLDDASAAFADFRTRSSPGKPVSKESSVLSGKGTLNLDIEATGPASNPWGFTGKGTATISGAELGHIRILGPLSKLFEGTILNLTSFRLTDANAVFALNGDKLVFSKLELTGPSAQLRSSGYYTMPTSELEFSTTIYPFRESPMLPLTILGFALEPFSKVLEVRLSGTLEKPKWAFAAGSSVPKYQPVAPPKLEIPTPPVPAPETGEAAASPKP